MAKVKEKRTEEVLVKEDYEVQTTFNEDGIEVLVEDGEVENINAEEVEGIGADGGFVKRTSKPGKGNKFYITDDKGGYSWCIQGKPTDKDCDVLANCVGYACGRFNEIIGKMKYPTLNCNAENFIERAKQAGLEIVDYPTLGGIIVMQRGATLSGGDGAGHVIIVEDILEYGANGYASKIYTSESGYGGSAFWNSTRSNANGRWGHGSDYKFRGCIVNPAVGKKNAYKKPTPTPTPTPTKSIDEVAKDVIAGKYGNYPERKERLEAEGYNYAEVQGRVNEMLAENKPAPAPIGLGDSVIVTGVGTSSSDGSGSITRMFNNRRMKVIVIRNNTKHPYACNQYNEGRPGDYSKITAWFSADDVRKG